MLQLKPKHGHFLLKADRQIVSIHEQIDPVWRTFPTSNLFRYDHCDAGFERTLYVADNNNNRIRKISPSGEVSTLAGSGSRGFADGTGTVAKFQLPTGVAVDSAGNVYVADYGNHRIRKITPSGEVSTLAGTGVYGFADGTGPVAQFRYPADVAVDSAFNVYVADYNNHRIRKITQLHIPEQNCHHSA